jgi:hypothetical protein
VKWVRVCYPRCAGWHTSDTLSIPDNISIVPLPPKSPELNPTENIWQFMRENWLSNRVFTSADDIVDHCCEAWNKLVDQPWRIMSIGMRQWAHGFQSMPLGISRDSPDDSISGVNIPASPPFVQAGREVQTATGISGTPNDR